MSIQKFALILRTWIGATHKLQGLGLVSQNASCTSGGKKAYLCANPENLSNRVASVEIIVVILPTLWSARPRPDRRRDLRNTAPMIFSETKERVPHQKTASASKKTYGRSYGKSRDETS